MEGAFYRRRGRRIEFAGSSAVGARHSCEVVSTPLYPRCAGVMDMPNILNNASPYFLHLTNARHAVTHQQWGDDGAEQADDSAQHQAGELPDCL